MKLPFNVFLNPIIRPYLGETRQFCQHPAFAMSIFYIYFYGALGFFINVNHIRKHLGEIPNTNVDTTLTQEFMMIHDLKIIATSMGTVQYACLLVGCFTANPALFLPHLAGQLIVFLVKIVNVFLLLIQFNLKNGKKARNQVAGILLMLFNWLQEFCVFRKGTMETESNSLLNQIRLKHENKSLNEPRGETAEGVRVRLRTLLVALLGVSMSACAFASQPVELELDDEDVAQKLSNVSFARRITKPTIRLVMGYGKLSAFITAASSLLLLVAVMSKQSWWRRGARWLAAPALLIAALEAASDAGDAMLAAALRGSTAPGRVVSQTAAAGLLVTVEILVWYFIAKFFEYNPPQTPEEVEKNNPHRITIPQ